MKDRNRQYKKYQHIDEDRQNLNHSQVPLSLVFIYNRGQLKNPDISGAIFTLSLIILTVNSQSVEGAKYVRVF